MADSLQHFKFAAGLAYPAGACFWAGGVGDGVDANSALDAFNADVLALPVLKTFTLGNQFDERVITHLAVLVRGPDAGLGQAACDSAGLLAIHGAGCVGADALGERSNDAVVAQGTGLATLEGRSLGRALQAAFEACGREKDGRFNERQANLGFDNCWLAAQQTS